MCMKICSMSSGTAGQEHWIPFTTQFLPNEDLLYRLNTAVKQLLIIYVIQLNVDIKVNFNPYSVENVYVDLFNVLRHGRPITMNYIYNTVSTELRLDLKTKYSCKPTTNYLYDSTKC